LLEVFEYAHKYYAHVLVDAVNYVHALLFGSENHTASNVLFKVVQLVKISIGTVKDVSDKRFRFIIVLHVFEEPLGDNNARYVRSYCREMAMTVKATVFPFDTRVSWFYTEFGFSHRHQQPFTLLNVTFLGYFANLLLTISCMFISKAAIGFSRFHASSTLG
jgi:hypothetical protein